MKTPIALENPFVTTGYVSAEYFCDREQETADIIRYLKNGNNVALISPRRYGKTDLIRHCFVQKEIADNYYTFIIDIYSTKSVSDMVNRLGRTILESLKPKGRKAIDTFLEFVSSLRAGITFDLAGNPSWTFSVGDISSPASTLEEIFIYLQNAEKPCLVAIDEFQQITKYGDDNIEAALRTQIQYCSNAHFIFSGSQRHLMGAMFTSPARPFYQSVTIYSLKLLSLEKYSQFCVHHFSACGKQLAPDVVPTLYQRFDGITFYLQRVMNELFSLTPQGAICSRERIDEAIDNILRNSAFIYEDLMYQLPEKQTLVLQAIAKDGKATNLTSGKFVKKHGLLSSSSVKSALPALIDKGLITNELGCYQVYDKFLELWINQF